MAGRKPKTITPEQRAEVETLGALLTQDQMADYFGIARPTMAAMMERDPDILLRYKKGRARVISSLATSLIMDARNGCVASRIFYLKTQAGWRETREPDPLTLPEGSSVTIYIPGNERDPDKKK